jgi:hypothetical protein
MPPSPDFRYLDGIRFLRTPGGWFVGNHANVKIKGLSMELGLEEPGYKECGSSRYQKYRAFRSYQLLRASIL